VLCASFFTVGAAMDSIYGNTHDGCEDHHSRRDATTSNASGGHVHHTSTPTQRISG
jgi:hypothetical protein